MSSPRKPIIAGNWKMSSEGASFVSSLDHLLSSVTDVEIVICAPFTALSQVASVLQNTSIKLGAQNVHWEKEGAFTGEIAASMLKEHFVRYVIVGHSERRQYFAETNETVNQRAKAALRHQIRPIICVGETLVQREADETKTVIREQVLSCLAGLTKDDIVESVIAYEPVWAIGTGRTATPEQAQEVHAYIRGLLVELFEEKVANKIRIQYGGSVKPANAKELLSQLDIDGALVGGASLEAQSFAQIVKSTV